LAEVLEHEALRSARHRIGAPGPREQLVDRRRQYARGERRLVRLECVPCATKRRFSTVASAGVCAV
jgi:hypothetical protein